MSPEADMSVVVDSGSFRDPNGRVYLFQGGVYRGLGLQALTQFRALSETAFFRNFSESGELISTHEIARPEWASQEDIWAGWLEHQVVPVISYPYEWTFSMLKDAAILQLRLQEAALLEGWSMKDATPYNIQFAAGKPVFIDIPSFEPLADGAPWHGYRQFCEMNLFPLLLQAYRGVDFQGSLRGHINGIGVQHANQLFSLRDLMRSGVVSHVWLQALLDRKYGNSSRDIKTELKSAGLNRELLLANVRKLQKLVRKLEWQPGGSEWAEYAAFHNYSEQDHSLKMDFVEQAAADSKARLAWDLGCNTGQFAALAAKHCENVLAMDADHLAVERLYLHGKKSESESILPLIQNLADPSPAWGWNHAERKTLEQRAKPGLVLALALIHHVVIGANIPIKEFLGWLAGLGGHLVIEFVDRKDEKVEQLLRNRSESYPDYNQPGFESALEKQFHIIRRQPLRNGMRTLYFCRPLPG